MIMQPSTDPGLLLAQRICALLELLQNFLLHSLCPNQYLLSLRHILQPKADLGQLDKQLRLCNSACNSGGLGSILQRLRTYSKQDIS